MNLPPFLLQEFMNPWNVLQNPQLMDFMKQSASPFPYNVMNPQAFKQNKMLPAPVNQASSLPPTLKTYQQILDSIQPSHSEEGGLPSSTTIKHSGAGQQKSEKPKSSSDQEKSKKKKKPNAIVSFDQLTAGTVSSSSGIFNGKNIQFGWSAHSKSNTGFGSVGGHNNKIDQNTNVVFDNDQLDTPIDDRDKMWSPVPSS